MAGKTRRLDIVIAGEDRSAGKTFKNVADDADRLGSQLKAAGRKAGQQFSSGLDSGVDKNGLASKMRGFGETASGAFKGAMLAGGVAAGAVFVGGFLQELDNEFATDKLVAQLGGSEWAGEMGELAGDLYVQNFGDSIADVGSVLKGVLQQGLLAEDASNDEIENLTRQVLTFADVLDRDATAAIRALSSILNSGLAKDGSEALDILTRGIQEGADKAEDLLDTFTEYSTMFRDIGIDAVSATGLLVQGLRAGARDADTVADALKEFAIRAQDASTTSAEGFKAIGLNAEEMTRKVARGGPEAREALDLVLDGLRAMEDPVARNAAAVALFGTKAEDLGDALFAMDLQGYNAGLGEVAGSTDDLGTAYDNAKSKIETFKRQAMEKLTTYIGEEVIPRLEDFAKWIGENEDAVKLFGTVLAVFVGTALAAYIASMATAAVATIAATWPILAVIAAIGLLALGLIYVKDRWNDTTSNVYKFRVALETVVGWIQTAWGWASSLVGIIASVASAFWNAVMAVLALASALKELNPVDAAKDVLGRIPGVGSTTPVAPWKLKAAGGPVTAGSSYIVGEEGPEWFVPDRSGVIVPNDMTRNMVASVGSSGASQPQVIQLVVSGRVLAEVLANENAIQSRNRAS